MQDARVRRVIAAYALLSPATLEDVEALYAADARFKDPFNEVQGRTAVRAIFEHMFRQVTAPRFVFHEAVAQGDIAFLSWTLHYRSSARAADEHAIRGSTELRFDAQGLVAWHRDYWDAAEELYEKLPLLGALMRALKRRLRA
ncbi:Putative transcriptional regulator [Rubrivivax sp. A210]|uniref:nuclear transport factor 2 family protein n=1 Tax=Rubrivivax sp. A210 TaxID=2772301 RepID=UPI0019993052|nr:nuclear transport factor 2 family protein [Rubrivivax sp. A210]CAD5367033.1 Putative transcriptional regulator [Rubrivivax sp. A210]